MSGPEVVGYVAVGIVVAIAFTAWALTWEDPTPPEARITGPLFGLIVGSVWPMALGLVALAAGLYVVVFLPAKVISERLKR